MKIKCPHCGKEIELSAADVAALMGSQTSERKAEASRANGKKGGRPSHTYRQASVITLNKHGKYRRGDMPIWETFRNGKRVFDINDPDDGEAPIGWMRLDNQQQWELVLRDDIAIDESGFKAII